MELNEARGIAEQLVERMRPYCAKIQIAGVQIRKEC